MAIECATEAAEPRADRVSTASASGDEAQPIWDVPLSSTIAAEASTLLQSIVRSLRARLGEKFDVAVITAAVKAELATYSAARISQFVPILVERAARERLCRRAHTDADSAQGSW